MSLVVGEYYYFNRKIIAAGTIKSLVSSDFVIRGMEFKEGEYIGEDPHTSHFRLTIGNTLYYFKIGRIKKFRPRFLLKPPKSI